MKVAFDIDGTLIHKNESGEDVPRYSVLNMLFSLKYFCTIFVWSGGGVEYAERWVRKLGLQDMVFIVSKSAESVKEWGIQISVDDEDCKIAPVNIRV